MSLPTPLRVEDVSDDRFLELARRGPHPVPIEQAPAWDAYDAAVGGREHLARLAVIGADDAPVAVVSLSRYEVRGFPYVWAKHGPIVLVEQTPENEKAIRDALVAALRERYPWAVFARLHARHAAGDLHELLQTVTFDHTVYVDLTAPEDQIMASFSKRGRYKIRRTLKDEAMTVAEETGLTGEQFEELYEIYRETAAGAGFGIFPAEMYLTMLDTLSPHARIWVARRHDAGPDGDLAPGRAVAWVIAVVHEDGGTDYYAANNLEARDTNAALRLKWEILTTLKAEGVREYDLFGVGSERAPQLMGVREFKQQFGEIVECDGAWDVPLKTVRYRALTTALRLKRAIR
ncbi:lipid II:glycine glycyltransferase FemX [Demequina lignilytica]|uniref:Peptidoglycan bridge formation glycyltransferase FemA/FemB family protein n=1 Tax=Demequina lignilytica TaxID=3051663 RepID=A0AB35MI86_9MICO|nr:peptidoglycan bridge formation glycyltransferase FemA/FemB family protein [Demequina sp. SYSU T0a273]MDN4483478.1 peptidoglycan bridge formation glycyltransferase FemA/FemB family protein [Demequina sp. SYSU T0a273]